MDSIAHIPEIIDVIAQQSILTNRDRYQMMLTCRLFYEVTKNHLDYTANDGAGFKHVAAVGDLEKVKELIKKNPELVNVSNRFALIFGTPEIQRLLVLSNICVAGYELYLSCVAINNGFEDMADYLLSKIETDKHLLIRYKNGLQHRVPATTAEETCQESYRTWSIFVEEGGVKRPSVKNPHTGCRIAVGADRFNALLKAGYIYNGSSLIQCKNKTCNRITEDDMCCAIKRDGVRCENKWIFSHGGRGYCGVHIRKFKQK